MRDFRVLILDDEPLARAALRVMLAADAEVAWIGEASSGPGAIELVRRERPDILLLDVQMPQMNGFDVVRELGDTERPEIVFVTAHDTHAIRAFDVAAADYLLKPFDDRRFALALGRAKERAAARAGDTATAQRSAPLERLVAKSVGRAVFIDVRDIEYVQAEDYYALVHARGESHLVRESMRDLAHRLPRGFIRIHRSTLVNAAFVAELVTDDEGEHIVVLRGGARLRASRGRREKLLEQLARG